MYTVIWLTIIKVTEWSVLILSVYNLNKTGGYINDTKYLIAKATFNHVNLVVNRLDAAMERERLVALEKEKAKEEAKRRYLYSKIQNSNFSIQSKAISCLWKLWMA